MSVLPESMSAIAITEPGGPEVLKPEARPVPEPGPGQILIKVDYSGVNRPDVIQRMGLYPAPPGASDLPGLEVSGEVVAVGEGVDLHQTGDKVCALTPGGGYAQYCVCHQGHALPVPSGLGMDEAGAIPETFFTVWSNVFDRGGLRSGETFMVHGGTSGIGTVAIQLAKAFGATVIATAGSDEKCEFCGSIGADHVINYKTQDFTKETKAITEGRGVDLILDMVGGDYVVKNWKAAAIEGRIVQIATLNGASPDANFALLMMKRLTHTGSTLRPRSDEYKTGLANALRENVWPLVAAGKVKPIMHSTFPLVDASKAHALMETNQHIGKIVLEV